jgi:hypothetical protein
MTIFSLLMPISGSFFNGDWCDEAMSEIIEIDNNGHPIPKAEKTVENIQVSFSLFSTLSIAHQARLTVTLSFCSLRSHRFYHYQHYYHCYNYSYTKSCEFYIFMFTCSLLTYKNNFDCVNNFLGGIYSQRRCRYSQCWCNRVGAKRY